MNLHTFYNIEFKNKKVDEWYKRLFIRLANILLPCYYYATSWYVNRKFKKKYNLNDRSKYIVSLTTFPARINKVWLAIESILRQKEKPDAIILWLYKGEFDGKVALPKSLTRLKKWIHIAFCDDNLMPHNKYFHTLAKYPEANIITVDDDVIYPPTLLEDLKDHHRVYPTSICSTNTRFIKMDNGTIQPYTDWHQSKGAPKESHRFQQLGVGGVLYPPNSLHEEIFNKEILKQKALKADDLWLKVMSLKKGTKIVSVSNGRQRKLLPVIIKNNQQLMDSNIGDGRNDRILKAIMDHYQLKASAFNDNDTPVEETKY